MSSSTPQLEIQNEVVRAGAGAGKTTTLIRRISETALFFQEREKRWPKIVVSTFTKKATQELRERLMVLACQEKPELLEFATSRSLIQISTIHGVLYRFLQKFGAEFGVDPGFQLVDGVREKWLSKRILHDILLESPDGKLLLEKHNFESLNSFFSFYFTHWLCREDLHAVSREDIEAILREKLREKAQRAKDLSRHILSEAEDEKWREFGAKIELISKSLCNSSVTQAREDVLRIVEATSRPRHIKKNPKVSEEVAEAVADFWPSLKSLEAKKEKDLFWSEEFWGRTVEQNQVFERVAEVYSARFLEEKVAGSELSLADLEVLSLYFLKKKPDVAQLFSQEWDYWMIDEYQDTSPIQVHLMRKLIGDRPSFVVGDPQQSIYLFRGARSEVFRDHEEYVRKIGGAQSELMQNYRSSPELLEFFNDFFDFSKSQFQRMKPREEVQNSGDTVARIAICSPSSGDDLEDIHPEYEAIASELHRLADSGVALDQICILGRVNRQLEELAKFLSEKGYPVHVHASSSFYERREICDALALLKFAVNPWDNLNLFTLLRSPWFWVSDETLSDWGRNDSHSLWEHIRSEKHEVVARLREVQSHVKTVGAVQAFWDAVRDSELLISTQYLDATRRREANLWKLYSQLKSEETEPGFNMVQFIERSSSVSVDESGGESDAVAIVEPKRINLMTVHASKGLQFDHVLVPHLDRAPQLSRKTGFCIDEQTGAWSIPVFSEEHQKNVYSALDQKVVERFQQAELEEQERLLYVALTRAKKTVFLSWQGEPHVKSALSRIEVDFSSGEHSSQKYSYEVQVGPWSSPDFKKLESEQIGEIAEFELKKADGADLKKVSVSQILESTKESEEGHESQGIEEIQRHSEIIQLGVQVHQVFEILRYGASVDEALEAMGVQENSMLRDGIEYVLSLAEPPMPDLIRRGKTEWGFLCKWKDSLIEGQIDLWGEVGGEIWIVDYKTGNTKYIEKAFRQLALYGHALSKRFDVPIQLAVVYPLVQKVVTKSLDEMKDYLNFALAQKLNDF